MKKTIKDIDLKGKRVLIRVDFNVPIKDGVITSNKRILAALPTINYAIQAGAKVILLSHLGRVKTEQDKKTKSLKIVAEELGKELRQKVTFIPETRGKLLENTIKDMMPKEVLMMENTRFEDLNNSAESKNSPELGKYWAKLGDVFVNDAFGTVHRAHASNVGIAKHIKESSIGFLVQEELSMLAKAIYGNKRPFVAIIGGAKITDKIKVINNLIDKVDYLIIGGGMAYTFYAAQGLDIGSSLLEKDQVPLATEYLKKHSDKIILPIDSNVSLNFANNSPLYNKDNSLEIPTGYMGLDIGPKTIKLFRKVLSGAKTVLWNGPMGVAEFDNYKTGTESVANIIASQPGVFSIIGGGDSAAAIIKLGLENQFSHISTGGGASLQFLEGAALPGIDSIQEMNKNSSSFDSINKPELTQPISFNNMDKTSTASEQKITKPVEVVKPTTVEKKITKPVEVIKPAIVEKKITKPVEVIKPAIVEPMVQPVIVEKTKKRFGFFGKKEVVQTKPVIATTTPVAVKTKTATTPVAIKSKTATTPVAIKTKTATIPVAIKDKTKTMPITIKNKTATTPIAVKSKTATTPVTVKDKTMPITIKNKTATIPVTVKVKPQHATQSIRVKPPVTPTTTPVDEKLHTELNIKKLTPHNLPINKTVTVNDKTGKVSIVRQIEK